MMQMTFSVTDYSDISPPEGENVHSSSSPYGRGVGGEGCKLKDKNSKLFVKFMEKLKPGKDYIGVGGGVLIFNNRKEVLLLKRNNNTRNEAGYWEKPGGMIDYGEKVIQAMKREIKEEVNLNIDIWGYLPHTDHIMKKEEQHWVAFNYLAKLKSGELKNMEPHKHDEVKWFALDKLPKKISQTTRESIKNYKEKRYIELR